VEAGSLRALQADLQPEPIILAEESHDPTFAKKRRRLAALRSAGRVPVRGAMGGD
jgi:hypothetical protein